MANTLLNIHNIEDLTTQNYKFVMMIYIMQYKLEKNK